MRVLTHVLGRAAYPLPPHRKIAGLVRMVFASERANVRGEINVIFVDGRTIQKLNRQFLHEKGTTDVIAFSYEKDGRSAADAPFGDIYICVPQAASNARRFRQTLAAEITRLLIHGSLHLLGYKDEKRPLQSRLWARQEALLKHALHARR